MCSCSTEQVFAWAGALLVNGAFISVIAWGAFTTWYIGFSICFVYTVLLFVSARAVDRRSAWDTVAPAEEQVQRGGDTGQQEETDAIVAEAASSDQMAGSSLITERRMPVMANFLYGLFTLAFGVTGYFLPMNVIPCDFYGSSNGYWSTNVSSLPSEVREWATTSEYEALASFVYLVAQETNYTLFQGTDGRDYSQTLWSVTGSFEPVNFPDVVGPSNFVDIKNGWACFTAYNNENIIGCSDGSKVTTTMGSSKYSFQSPFNLIVDNDSNLWFKDFPLWTQQYGSTGTLIYSINDYETMAVELHSSHSTTTDIASAIESPEFEDSECWTKQMVFATFISALPTAISSIIIWLQRTAPAMAITTYIGISALAAFIYLASVGDSIFEFDTFWGWWLSISASFYVMTLCDLTHCERQIAQTPLAWGINFGSVAFFVGMIFLTRIYGYGDYAWSWVVFNTVAIIPLGVIGLGYNQVFLLVLCAAGWLMTAVQVASALADVFSTATVPIYFVVLAFGGILIAGIGWLLNKHQDQIQQLLTSRMEKMSLSRRYFPAREGREQSDDNSLLSE